MRDSAIYEAPQANLTKYRHSLDRAFEPRGNPLQIFWKQLAGGIPFGVPAARSPRLRQTGILIYADQSALLFLTEIAGNMRAAHNGDFFFAVLERRNGIGDDIMMLHIGHRNVDACHLRDLPRIAAGCIYNDFRADRAFFGLNIPFACRQLGQAGHAVFAHNLRAHILCTNGKRIADARWVSMSVFRGPRAGDDTIKCHERVVPENFLRRDNLHFKADDLRKAFNIAHPREFAFVRRKTDAARFMPAYILPSEPLKPRVELIAIRVHLGEIIASGDVWALPGGVPGGAGCELVLFNQQTVGPAKLCQMVEQRCPHYAATNNNNPRRCLHDSCAP